MPANMSPNPPAPSCAHCGATTINHCHKDMTSCDWRRCVRCHSYGRPGADWRLYDKGAAFNLYSLSDLQVSDPAALPVKRQAISGYTD